MLQGPSAAGQLRVSRLVLDRELAGGDAASLVAEGVRYVARLEARVAAGELDVETAAAAAGRIARFLTRTGSRRDPV